MLVRGFSKMKALTDEENEMINKLWARYHDGGLKDLPSQVYFDMGWFHGLVSKLSDRIDKLQQPQYFGSKK